MSMNTYPDRSTVSMDGFHATVSGSGVVIDTPEGSLSISASAAIALSHMIGAHLSDLVNASHNERHADLWEAGAKAAADLAGQGVDIYHLTLEWAPDYATRRAEIRVASPEVVRKHGVGEVQELPHGLGLRTESELADAVLLVSVHYPAKPADPTNVPAQVIEQATEAAA